MFCKSCGKTISEDSRRIEIRLGQDVLIIKGTCDKHGKLEIVQQVEKTEKRVPIEKQDN